MINKLNHILNILLKTIRFLIKIIEKSIKLFKSLVQTILYIMDCLQYLIFYKISWFNFLKWIIKSPSYGAFLLVIQLDYLYFILKTL